MDTRRADIMDTDAGINRSVYPWGCGPVDPIWLDAYHAYTYAKEYTLTPGAACEIALSKCAEFAAAYAIDIVKGPFPAGEAVIAEDTHYAFIYAQQALKGRFVAGEPAIYTDPDYAFWYARDVLGGPVDAVGEAMLATKVYAAFHYAIEVLNARFYLAEERIADPKALTYGNRYLLEFPAALEEWRALGWRPWL